MPNLKNVKIPEDIIVGFKRKPNKHAERLTEQDKKHIRIMAILEIAKGGIIQKLIDEAFVEEFEFDVEKQVVYYKVRFIKERGNICQQSLVN